MAQLVKSLPSRPADLSSIQNPYKKAVVISACVIQALGLWSQVGTWDLLASWPSLSPEKPMRDSATKNKVASDCRMTAQVSSGLCMHGST